MALSLRLLDRDRDRAAFGHRVARVDDQVDQRKLELGLIGEGVPGSSRELPVDLDQAAEGVARAGRRPRPASAAMSIAFGASFCRRAKASSRRTSSAPCSAAGCVMAEDLPLLVLERGPPLDQAEAADDRSEQIVEVVRDAAGQLADRIHLARLDQLSFRALAVGDVE